MSAYTVLGGQLVLLTRPGAGKLESQLIGTDMAGRQLHKGEPLGWGLSWR